MLKCNHLRPSHFNSLHSLPSVRLLTLHDYIDSSHMDALLADRPFCDRLEYLRFTRSAFNSASLHRIMNECTSLLAFHIDIYHLKIERDDDVHQSQPADISINTIEVSPSSSSSSSSPLQFSDFIQSVPESFRRRLLSLCINTQQLMTPDQQLLFHHQLWLHYPQLRCCRVGESGKVKIADSHDFCWSAVTSAAIELSVEFNSTKMLSETPDHDDGNHALSFENFTINSSYYSFYHDASQYRMRSEDQFSSLPSSYLTRLMLPLLRSLKYGSNHSLTSYEEEFNFPLQQSQFDFLLPSILFWVIAAFYWYTDIFERERWKR